MSEHEISIAFQTDKSASRYVSLAKLVNQYPFDAVSVYCDLPFHTPFPVLMLMAPHIERARLGVAAVSPSRIHPLDIAAQTALLAEVARGGVYVGLARGAWLEDHGITEHRPPLQTIREAVDLIRYMLNGDVGGYEGEVYRIAPHVRAPYPLPPARVPVLIGCWGRQLCTIAGEVADEVKVGGSANPDLIDRIRSYIARGEEHAKRVPGTVRIVMGAVCVVDEDREHARLAAKQAVALYLPVVAPLDPTLTIEPELILRLRNAVHDGALDSAARLVSDDLLGRFAFAGNAHDLIEQAGRLYLSGAGRIEFGTPHGLHSETGIRIIGEQVLPALKEYIT